MSVFGAYHLLVLFFTLLVEFKDGYIYTLLNKVYLFKYAAMLGLLLFAIEFLSVKKDYSTDEEQNDELS